jgi:hypothetical protein
MSGSKSKAWTTNGKLNFDLPSLALLYRARAKCVAYKTFLECFRLENLDPETLEWSGP